VKICVTAAATGSADLDARVDPRFGRCPYFLLVDSESLQFEPVPNLAATSGSGAGIRAAQTIANRGVQVLITGNVGPKAFQALSAAGISVITGVSGKVGEAIEKYKGGLLSETNCATVRGHFGMKEGNAGLGRRREQP
jgi:predicted Fe-Mo cluster-binding NifX family protein